MTCSKGCGCGDHKAKSYGSLQYCAAHKKYDVCSYKAPHGDKCCPPKVHKVECECECDKKEQCCDNVHFNCEDLSNTTVTKSVSSEAHGATNPKIVSVNLMPSEKHCKVVGFTWDARNSRAVGKDAVVKSITVRTCKDVICLTKCELGDDTLQGTYELHHECECKPSHEIKSVDVCVGFEAPSP